ncbi:MAG: helix-turn-helix domain-containing protein [archaeon]|nr:helix-turn-helix domain-containing protein [archaeon]
MKKSPDVFAFNTFNAAKFIGCSESLLRKFRSVGEGPAYSKLGKKIVYPLPELKRYLKENLVS